MTSFEVTWSKFKVRQADSKTGRRTNEQTYRWASIDTAKLWIADRQTD